MSVSTKANFLKNLVRVGVLVACLMAMAVSALAQQNPNNGLSGFAISPLMFRKTASRGSSTTLSVKINNLEAKSLTATLKILPVVYAGNYYGADTSGKKTRFDCSSWFADSVVKTVVGPQSEREVILKYTVPRDIPNGVYYCLGLVDPTLDQDTNKILAEYELPIIFFVGQQPKLDLSFASPNLVTNPKGDSYVEVPFSNPSEAFTVVGAVVTIRNQITGSPVGKPLVDTDRNLYPETNRTLRLSLDTHLGDGSYTVQVVFQAGTRAFRPVTANFIVKNGVAYAQAPGMKISLPPFLVEPPSKHIDMAAGARRSIPLKFTNTTDGPLTLSLTAHKLVQGANGALGAMDDGPSQPLTVDLVPSTLTILPRRVVMARVEVGLDAGATGDSWFAVSARSATGDSLSEEVYCSVRVPKTEQPKMQLTMGSPEKIKGVPVSIDYDVANTGNIALAPLVSAGVATSDLVPIATCEVPQLGDGGIIPGAVLHNRIMLPLTLKPGTYVLQLSYQYGADLYERKVVPFTIPVPKPAPAPKKGGGGR